MSTVHSELVIALVAAVGTDVGHVAEQVATKLAAYNYQSDVFRLSDYLAEQADEDYRGKPFDEQLWDAMSAGDKLRETWDRDDALALHAISDMVATREELSDSTVETSPGESEPENLQRFAFVLRSLKTPDELETLRAVYGPRLVVVSAYSPKERRLAHLDEQIEDSRNNADKSTWTYQPEELVDRDEKEELTGGQDVSGTFHRADFFIRAWDREVIGEDLERVMAILFGDPFRTPTRDEFGQFQAAGAALRSAEFGRQVGAAIAAPDGSVIALGTNEVPRYLGGSRWDEDLGTGNRDFEIGDRDTNRAQFDELTDELVKAVGEGLRKSHEEAGENAGEAAEVNAEGNEAFLADLPRVLREAGLKNLTEFGRAVHAEMDALLDAARRGAPVRGATLFTTTFPCHNCARHIVAAGIKRVVFIEPYTKSRAGTLHDDSIAVDPSDQGSRLIFEPFVGVAPRRYLEMFDAAGRERLGHIGRADSAGRKQELDKETALPVFVESAMEQFRPELPGYRARELLALDHFNQLSGVSAKDQPDDSGANPSEATTNNDEMEKEDQNG